MERSLLLVVSIGIVVATSLVIYRRRRTGMTVDEESSEMADDVRRGSSTFGHLRELTYEEMKKAAVHVGDARLSGRGGSGSVNRAELPDSAVEIMPDEESAGMRPAPPLNCEAGSLSTDPPIDRSSMSFSDNSETRGITSGYLRELTYELISTATEHFSDARLLGQGLRSRVYRCEFPDGAVFAVKRMTDDADIRARAWAENYGADPELDLRMRTWAEEFAAKVRNASEVSHRHLMKLRGWCHDQGTFLLVYDFMANRSLDCLQHDDDLCRKLTWGRRFAVATGVVSALAYLHESDNVIVHSDVKPSSVLLDDCFFAKLGDCGMSGLVDAMVAVRISSIVPDTLHYKAPECYYSYGREATKETDMYAFGVLLLEMVCGKRPISFFEGSQPLMVEWVWNLFGQGRVLEAVDQRLGGEWDRVEAERMLVVGLACSHTEPECRPKARDALEALEGTVELPHVPLVYPTWDSTPPGFTSG